MANSLEKVTGAQTASDANSIGSTLSEFNDVALSQLLGAYLQNQGQMAQPEYTGLTNAALMDIPTMQQALGTQITYDRDAIEKLYTDATKEAYGMERESGAENKYFRALAASSSEAQKAMSDQYNRAASQGAAQGMLAANQLSSILGISQQAQEQAQQLAVDRQALVKEYAQQLMADKSNALKYSNDTQSALAQNARQLYNDSIQAKTAELAYNQAINTDRAGYMANKDTVLGNLLGNLGTAASNAYANNTTSLASIQNAIAQADATKNQKLTYGGDYTVHNLNS